MQWNKCQSYELNKEIYVDGKNYSFNTVGNIGTGTTLIGINLFDSHSIWYIIVKKFENVAMGVLFQYVVEVKNKYLLLLINWVFMLKNNSNYK